MKRLPNDIDIHTHSGPLRTDAILCVDPTERPTLPEGEGLISAGIHPWNAATADSETWQRLVAWLDDPRVVAVGEIGLDRLRGPHIDLQSKVFADQAVLAAERGLPVVIHCVRAVEMLPAIRKRIVPAATQWIVHGFRGKPELARQLLDAGIDLSFGGKYNIESFDITPPTRRYTETD